MMRATILTVVFFTTFPLIAQDQYKFGVIAFYTAKHDRAHISFVHEANRWFSKMASENQFQYDSTNDWSRLNAKTLSNYDVVIFLDTRPEAPEQRKAFEEYILAGGAWLGFHFSAFALTPSTYNQNWDWYHNTFLGCGQYRSNTWRPTSAVLRVERSHPVTKNLPDTFRTAPNEWYSWEKDLRKNSDIEVLCSIDSASFPLGTGPKPHEIWLGGDYPVAWTNRRYKMVYINMGHNDIDYEAGSNRELSFTFTSPMQNRLIIQSLFWLAGSKPSTIHGE